MACKLHAMHKFHIIGFLMAMTIAISVEGNAKLCFYFSGLNNIQIFLRKHENRKCMLTELSGGVTLCCWLILQFSPRPGISLSHV